MGYSSIYWLPCLVPENDPNIVYVVHQYEPVQYTHQTPPLKIRYPGEFDIDWDGRRDSFNKRWMDELFGIIDEFKAEQGAPVTVMEFGLMRWEPGAASFMDDEMSLFEQRGINHALWVWDSS